MSDEPKKYPPDTPVTLEMLADILRKVSVKCKSPTAGWICEMVEEHIEPPTPEPEDGKWYLCEFVNGKRSVYLYKDDCWLSHTDDPPRRTAVSLEKSIKVIAEMKEVARE